MNASTLASTDTGTTTITAQRIAAEIHSVAPEGTYLGVLAAILDSDGQLLTPQHLVEASRPADPEFSVRLAWQRAGCRQGDDNWGSTSVLSLSPALFAPKARRVVLVAAMLVASTTKSLSSVKQLSIRFFPAEAPYSDKLPQYDLPTDAPATAIVLGEFYHDHTGPWQLRRSDRSYEGLATFCREIGFTG